MVFALVVTLVAVVLADLLRTTPKTIYFSLGQTSAVAQYGEKQPWGCTRLCEASYLIHITTRRG
jgi:hypothetical protein